MSNRARLPVAAFHPQPPWESFLTLALTLTACQPDASDVPSLSTAQDVRPRRTHGSGPRLPVSGVGQGRRRRGPHV